MCNYNCSEGFLSWPIVVKTQPEDYFLTLRISSYAFAFEFDVVYCDTHEVIFDTKDRHY